MVRVSYFERFIQWIDGPQDRRAWTRLSLPLLAFYWNGGSPEGYRVTSVSAGGAYIVTADRWYPGTILNLTFQYDPQYLKATGIAGNRGPSLSTRAKLVRAGTDGVGVQLMHVDKGELHAFQRFLAGATVRRTR